MIEIIDFKTNKNLNLRGLLHIPEVSHRNGKIDLIIFPNGGIMGAEGDFRAHVRIARDLQASGFYVLRFSPTGLGYSDGFIADTHQRDLFGQLETGLLVDDVKAAIKYIKKKIKPDTIILSGICGGAITSFLAAAQIKDVKHVIPIGIPVVLDSSNNADDLRMAPEIAKNILKSYTSKIFSLKSWLRILTLRSDFNVIKIALSKVLFKKSSTDSENENDKYRTNAHFFDAAKKIFNRKKKAFFIFGDSDRFWWEFNNLYIKRIFVSIDNVLFDHYLVPNGNHMLTMVEMQDDASNKIKSWLKKNLE